MKTCLQTARQESLCPLWATSHAHSQADLPAVLAQISEVAFYSTFCQHSIAFLLGPKLRFIIHITISLKHPALAELGVTWTIKMIPK